MKKSRGRTAPTTLRPVSARALKSSLDTLRPHLAGSRCLDLFCGSGRFGLGALKEGAAEVTFVDLSRSRLKQVTEDAKRFDGQCITLGGDAFQVMPRLRGPFDVIFADPPFPQWTDTFSETLFTSVGALLSEEGIFLVKHPARVVPSGQRFTRWKTTTVGESGLSYFAYGD